MIDKDKLKIYSYETLKPFLSAQSSLVKVYEKAKDKKKFNVFFVYEGNVETAMLNVSDDIGWAAYYKFVNQQDVNSFFGPIVLGNITCETLVFNKGMIIGNVDTKNMSVMYSDQTNSFSEITGVLNVSEVLIATGKGLWGKAFNLDVYKSATINTFINNEQANINANSASIKKTFNFPQIYETEERGKDALKTTDWSNHSLDELTAHFNVANLNVEKYGEEVSFFFREHTVFCKGYAGYLNE